MLRVPGQWTPAAIAVVVFLAVVGVGLMVTRADDSGASSPTTASAGDGNISMLGANDSTTTMVVPDTAATSTVAQNAVAKVPLDRTLSNGVTGADVAMVQQRLADLKFDPGPVDGVFGSYTVQAVWAFETLVMKRPRAEAAGRVSPEMWDLMQDNVTVAPRRTNLTSTHVEIYLPEQSLVVFKDNVPALIAHISSGELAPPGDDFMKGAEWCSEVTIDAGEEGNREGTEPIKDGRCGNSMTPGGTYRFYRTVEGRRESALGGMYDPVYFNYGIAVHGAENVPIDPASHGCIRINRRLGPIFQSMITQLGKNSGDQVYVWNGVEEPESYGAKSGIFDKPDLEWRAKNSTTSSTSSTTSTTVPGATTTLAPVTTPAPPAATTTTTTTTAVPPPPTEAPTLPPTTAAPTAAPGP